MPNDFPAWFRRRGYLHFDSPVKFESAQKLVTSPKRAELCSNGTSKAAHL